MTTLPPNADELVSAYLDDQATPDEVATVEADGALMARVAELREQQQALAVGPPTAGMRDLHIDAALAEFDRVHGQDSPGSAAVDSGPGGDQFRQGTHAEPTERDRVVLLEEARERRRPWRLGLIAAALVTAVTIIGALSLGGTSDESADTAAFDMATDASDAADTGIDTSASGAAEAAPQADQSNRMAQDDTDIAAGEAGAAASEDAIESAAVPEEAAPMAQTMEAEAEAAEEPADEDTAADDAGAVGFVPGEPIEAAVLASTADLDGVIELARTHLNQAEPVTTTEGGDLIKPGAAHCAGAVPTDFVIDPNVAPMLSIISEGTGAAGELAVEIYAGYSALLVLDADTCRVIDVVER